MEFESWTNFSIIKSTKETIVVKPNLLTCMLSSIHTPLEQKESGQSRANCCGLGHHSAQCLLQVRRKCMVAGRNNEAEGLWRVEVNRATSGLEHKGLQVRVLAKGLCHMPKAWPATGFMIQRCWASLDRSL